MGRTLDEVDRQKPLPDDLSHKVRRILDTFHKGGFVFGDLKLSDLMLALGNRSAEQCIRVIDFDCAGRDPLFAGWS